MECLHCHRLYVYAFIIYSRIGTAFIVDWKNMYSKILTFLISIIFTNLLLQQAYGEEKPATLVVSNANDWPPFSFVSVGGEPRGLFVDIWTEFGKVNNVDIQFRLVSWQSSLDLVKNNQVDIHGGLLQDSKRAEYMEFTTALNIPFATRLLISVDYPGLNVDTLQNLTVGVVEGDYAETYLLENINKINLRMYKSAKDLVRSAILGEVKTFAMDLPTSMFYLHKYGEPGSFYISDKLFQKELFAAVPKNKEYLLEFINNGLSKINKDDFERITQKWMLPEPAIPSWLLPLIAGSFAFILAVFVSVYIIILRKHKRNLVEIVEQRTHELQHKNKQLEFTLSEIKQLRSFLPICASCKKIRDDQGYWKQIEEYIQSHTGTQFSHSICPECEARLYSELKKYT